MTLQLILTIELWVLAAALWSGPAVMRRLDGTLLGRLLEAAWSVASWPVRALLDLVARHIG